ncbi:MAG: DegV family protein [Bacillota bacterium]|nr:DegV family protein [Bacillota bacterium]
MATEKIALITDSTCDLPDDIVREYDIRILPLKVLYQDHAYDDRFEIGSPDVIATIDREIPRTSMPAPARVTELLNQLVGEGFTHAVAIHLSSGLSGTGNVVRMVGEQVHSLRLEVIDSKSISMGLGFLVREAGVLIKDGLNLDEVSRRVRSLQERIQAFFIVRSLEYLRRNGRIGLVPATLGSILDIRPVISINEAGKYYAYTKVRGWRRALARIADIVREKAAGARINLAVMHAGAPDDGRELHQRVLETGVAIEKLFLGEIGPGMIVHSGPGLVGLAFYRV